MGALSGALCLRIRRVERCTGRFAYAVSATALTTQAQRYAERFSSGAFNALATEVLADIRQAIPLSSKSSRPVYTWMRQAGKPAPHSPDRTPRNNRYLSSAGTEASAEAQLHKRREFGRCAQAEISHTLPGFEICTAIRQSSPDPKFQLPSCWEDMLPCLYRRLHM